MSGRDRGGVSSGNFGGGGATTLDCQGVSIKTSIIAPDPTILAMLSPGNYLTISLQSATGPLTAITADGNILGAIFTTNPVLLIDCINQGYVYKAKILSILGGDCQVLITTK